MPWPFGPTSTVKPGPISTAVSVIEYGSFITNAVDFALVAAAIFFFVIKPYNELLERRRAGQEEEPTPEPEELSLLREIAQNTARA